MAIVLNACSGLICFSHAERHHLKLRHTETELGQCSNCTKTSLACFSNDFGGFPRAVNAAPPFFKKESALNVSIGDTCGTAGCGFIKGARENETLGEETFNRAKLLNVGYTETLKDGEYDCFIFSDVDLIPMDDRNLYHCYDQPRHFAIAMDKFGFRLPYAGYFGGVSGLSKKQFLKINGFPNEYWGWGGEDDDIYNRADLL
ncbi:Beta-1,4-galactosyltransferase 2 [Merluccius polli]|uniref:Beta-1,4-galactosyltransferase 2 n=1 Tax=Merluccius polli TaxID=89951 RepID=A0AA47N5Z5_MERPO|nr:Beta-1,4-galactosyltransferase 2 [Merluccius polli]